MNVDVKLALSVTTTTPANAETGTLPTAHGGGHERRGSLALMTVWIGPLRLRPGPSP